MLAQVIVLRVAVEAEEESLTCEESPLLKENLTGSSLSISSFVLCQLEFLCESKAEQAIFPTSISFLQSVHPAIMVMDVFRIYNKSKLSAKYLC